MSSTAVPKVVPAHLSFLAVYNPSLGSSDETLHEQILFYFPKPESARPRHGPRKSSTERELRNQENEKLRQVGLAQAMVEFARGFSDGSALNSVDTHHSRIVMHELEPSWWILASIQLTQLPSVSHTKSDPGSSDTAGPAVEYSAREVSPPALLVQQLLCAHSVFLLHHASSIQELFLRLGRVKLSQILDKFWNRFCLNWDVLLHGSPAVEVFGGIKLAAGGELGIGVGEEEWGSGEREVLEDYIRRTDGLVDVLVSRFGEPCRLQTGAHKRTSLMEPESGTQSSPDYDPWLGSGKSPDAVDGMVFSGLGAVSRKSLRALSRWIETVYSYGDCAYGVRENPNHGRRKRQRRQKSEPESRHSSPVDGHVKDVKQPSHQQAGSGGQQENSPGPRIPPPIVQSVESSLHKALATVDSKQITRRGEAESPRTLLGDSETWTKYLTLGYGTAWGGSRAPNSTKPSPSPNDTIAGKNEDSRISESSSMRYIDPQPDVDDAEELRQRQIRQENTGYFIIGLQGDMTNSEEDDTDDDGNWNNRIPLRTVYAELANETSAEEEGGNHTVQKDDEMTTKSSGSNRRARLRPIVYIHRPFIYTFLFDPQTESLALASFYRNLHTYFSPLHRPLSNSTSPDRVSYRIAAASDPHTTVSGVSGAGSDSQRIFDLVYDPRTLTVHSSIPNIPDPGTLVAEGLSESTAGAGWSRVDALNVHSQILATVSGTRSKMSEVERTCKTSRGWWVVWMRLAPSGNRDGDERDLREAFLVRRAREGTGSRSNRSSASARAGGSGLWRLGGPSTSAKMGGAGAGWGPRGLAEGIGIDARRYVEGLLSLNR